MLSSKVLSFAIIVYLGHDSPALGGAGWAGQPGLAGKTKCAIPSVEEDVPFFSSWEVEALHVYHTSRQIKERSRSFFFRFF